MKKTSEINIALFGFSELTKATLEALAAHGFVVKLYTHTDSIQKLCNLGITYSNTRIFYYKSMDSAALSEDISKFGADYIIVAGLNEKVPASVANLAKCQAFNIHPSLLPKYRGANPWYWVIYHGEKISGITVHKLTDVMDQGDIAHQLCFELDSRETIGTYDGKVKHYLPKLVEEMVPKLGNNDFDFKKQERSTYFHKPTKIDAIIDWNRSAIDIDAQVRAGNPFLPGVFCLNQGIYKVYELKVTSRIADKPGHLKITDNQFLISASDYYLEIKIINSGTEGFFSGHRFARFCGLKTGAMCDTLSLTEKT